MSKIKMRCITCGKWFQSANAKEVTCPDCTQKARKEKLASKNAPPSTNRPAGPSGQAPSNAPRPPIQPPKPKPAPGGTSHWFDTLDDVKIAQPEQPPIRPKLPSSPAQRENRSGPGGYREGNSRGPGSYREGGNRGPGEYRESGNRGPGGYREGNSRGPGAYRDDYRGVGSYRPNNSSFPGTTFGQRPRQPIEGGLGRPSRPNGAPNQRPKPKAKVSRPPAPPKPKREKTPPPQPFVATAEQVKQVEERYLELATPSEFDGIRTQIAQELKIPKKAVKKIIKELRSHQSIPSWWELQTYKGSTEELEKIKAAYLPLLPVPPVGVHKKIADELTFKPGIVYQAIKAIRLEMNLPQYNDPVVHGTEEPATDQANGEQASIAEEPVAQVETDISSGLSESATVEHTVSAVSVAEGQDEQEQTA